MQLSKYIKDLPAGEQPAARRRIAKTVGVSENSVHCWCIGRRKPALRHWHRIRIATGWKVTIEDLFNEFVDQVND